MAKRTKRARLILGAVVLGVILAGNLWFVIPGLLAGKPLFGTPNSGAIYSSGGFHCSGDSRDRIHFHTCAGEPLPLPKGTTPGDFPDVSQ
jgi:hypothetical protein